jgi:RNA polymerase sigma factor (sigma-70 family)
MLPGFLNFFFVYLKIKWPCRKTELVIWLYYCIIRFSDLCDIIMSSLTDTEILRGIQTNNKEIVEMVYSENYKAIRNLITDNSGTADDVREVYHDAFIIIYQKAKEGTLVLTCSFSTFLYAICKNIWYKRLRDRQPVRVELIDLDEQVLSCLPDLNEISDRQYKESLFMRHFMQLGTDCRKILKLFIQNTPLREISRLLNTSEGYIRKRKHLCKERLISNIKQDPKYLTLKKRPQYA